MNNEEPLLIEETVKKMANSKSRYLRIPDNHFKEIKHGHIAKISTIENENEIKIIYIFNKNNKR